MKWGGLYMAKLTGVKVIDMAGGAITAIEYGGEVYSKVEVPRIGDICEIVNAWGTRGVGEFHNVFNISKSLGNTYVHIEEGVNQYVEGFNYFRKASASAPFAEMVVSRVAAVEQRMDAVEAKLQPAELTIGDRVLISGISIYKALDFDGNFGKLVKVDYDGEHLVQVDGESKYYFHRNQLTKVAGTEAPVKPEFIVGDRVRALVVGEFNDIKRGEYGTINDLDEYADSDPYYIEVETDAGKTDFFRPQDLELAADEALKVGDYAVVITSDRVLWTYAIGDVAPVVGFRSDGFPIVQAADKKEEPMHSSQIRKATDAEVVAATTPAQPKTGVIVVITANSNDSCNRVGDIGKAGDNDGRHSRVIVHKRGTTANWTLLSEMRLATPAEIAQYEAAAAALKPKEPALKVGDTVRVEGSSWFKDGAITKVKRLGGWNGDKSERVLLEGAHNGLSVETKYVTKVDAEAVFTKAGRKPNKFSEGDVVRVTGEASHNLTSGDVGIVTELSSGFYRVTVSGKRNVGNLVNDRQLEIVCFAENRADLAKGACGL